MVYLPPTNFRAAMTHIAQPLIEGATDRITSLFKRQDQDPNPTKKAFNHEVNKVLTGRLPQVVTDIVLNYCGSRSYPESSRLQESIRKCKLLLFEYCGGFILNNPHAPQYSISRKIHDTFSIVKLLQKHFEWSFPLEVGSWNKCVKELNEIDKKIKHELTLCNCPELFHGFAEQRTGRLLAMQVVVQIAKDQLQNYISSDRDLKFYRIDRDLSFCGIDAAKYPSNFSAQYMTNEAMMLNWRRELIREIHRTCRRDHEEKEIALIENELAEIRSSDGDYVFGFDRPMDIVSDYINEDEDVFDREYFDFTAPDFPFFYTRNR